MGEYEKNRKNHKRKYLNTIMNTMKRIDKSSKTNAMKNFCANVDIIFQDAI